MPELFALPPNLGTSSLKNPGIGRYCMACKRDQNNTMFEKRHRITLLFNANKAYDRRVVEGVGEYLQASQLEWDIFIEEDFRARIENIKEWLGDGVIADYDDRK